jgi:hypothetical protein
MHLGAFFVFFVFFVFLPLLVPAPPPSFLDLPRYLFLRLSDGTRHPRTLMFLWDIWSILWMTWMWLRTLPCDTAEFLGCNCVARSFYNVSGVLL